MKQQYKSILEAIISIILAALAFLFINDYMFKYGLPAVFVLLAIYKINESLDFFKK